MTKVLIIDDDQKLSRLVTEYLPQFQFDVAAAFDGPSGLKAVDLEKPEIVILDIMLPGMDGMEVCRQLRKTSHIPILFLSARGESSDRIVGLELGADDFLAKPFEPRELVARLQAILRRVTPGTRTGRIYSRDLEIRESEREAFLAGRPLKLTSMEFDLLWLLATNPGRKLSRDEIAARLQGFEPQTFSRAVDVLVSRLRGKLGETAREARFIKSSHGVGYVFVQEA